MAFQKQDLYHVQPRQKERRAGFSSFFRVWYIYTLTFGDPKQASLETQSSQSKIIYEKVEAGYLVRVDCNDDKLVRLATTNRVGE